MKLIKNTKVITPFIEILDAYIVAIDEDINIFATMVEGNIVYNEL